MKKTKFDIISTIFLIIMLLVGLSVMAYPTFSDWWNKNKATHVISDYQKAVSQLNTEDYQKYFQEAYDYNKKLAELSDPFTDYPEIEGYDDILDITGTGILGHISIPAIRVELPVYHGTSEGVLNIAVGHFEGSSLPVGGSSTHSVLSGHRGLPSAKLFTDLDKIVVGDYFTINVLNEVLTYEVEEINIVNPNELDKLMIVPGGDKVTLVTCTPYGVNTHRLLIRSKRIATFAEKTAAKVSSDAVQVDSLISVPIISIPLFLGLFLFWGITGRRKKRRDRINQKYLKGYNYKSRYKFV